MSCVPACPYLVCFLSLFNVIISEVCSSRVCLINLCILVPVCSVSCRLVYSLLPGVPVCVSLALFVYIKDYYLSLLLVCVFLYPPRVCAHRDMLQQWFIDFSPNADIEYILYIFMPTYISRCHQSRQFF